MTEDFGKIHGDVELDRLGNCGTLLAETLSNSTYLLKNR